MWPLFASIVTFAVSMSISPGPNNLMVTASGANFGFRRTIPHMLGISFGFPVMLLAIGLGLGQALAAWPQVHAVLRYVAAAYLLYLAWRIATAGGPGEAVARGRPFTFLQAAAFQWVNPKAWVIALSAVATYTAPDGSALAQILLIGAVFVVAAFLSLAVWAAFGTLIAGVLRSPRALRAFNLCMAGLLVLSLVPVFM
ncbi:MAG: LysE family translocator [Thalassobaculum sp.]|uniref:LysE family translocator n=1 Tax=Thalassobaculum sp. TaxID=2022740 RepID=UPI0032F09495